MVRKMECNFLGTSAQLRTTCEMLSDTIASAPESQCNGYKSEFFGLGCNATLCKARGFIYVNLEKK